MATATIPFDPESAQFPTSNPAEYRRANGTNFPVTGLYFDATTQETAFFRFTPAGFASAPVLTIIWYADSASANGVVWEAAVAAVTPNSDSGDVETKAFATAQSVADTHLGTTGQRMHSVDLTISNTDSMAAGDACWLRVARLTGDGNDTMAGFAILERMALAYTTA